MTDRPHVNRLGITRGELISCTVAVIIAISGYWISTERRITILEAQMKEVQETKAEFKEDMKDLKNSMQRIELLLKDKQDKK
jgi:uncharacterized membrane protein (DUF106 family)